MKKFLYGAFFVIVLPIFLYYWAKMLDSYVNLPHTSMTWLAMCLVVLGAVTMILGILSIIIKGQGLPMNMFPPKKFVSSGIYEVFSHPIYVGAITLCFGIFSLMDSSAGLFIVSPIFALMTISLVYGYEEIAIKKLFSDSLQTYEPLFSLPIKTNSYSKRIMMLLRILIPLISLCLLWGIIDIRISSDVAFVIIFIIFIVIYLLTSDSVDTLYTRTNDLTITSISFFVIYFFLNNWVNESYLFVLLAFCLPLLTLSLNKIWMSIRNISEKVANARKDYLFFDGKFRIISHAIYPTLSGIVAGMIFYFVTSNIFAAFFITVFTLVGGAVFAQSLWGSKKLLRPFGYYGGVIGAIVGTLICKYLLHIDFTLIALGTVIASPFAQAISRFRCLEQGCCHGIEVSSSALGIKVENPQSRICLNSKMGGKYLLATQTYSIIFNFILGVFLLFLWRFEILPSTLIIGLYLVLTGIERFTEDAYRGEVQTRKFYALNEPQFFGLLCLLLGIIMTLIPSNIQIYQEVRVNLNSILLAMLCGLFAGFMMSMDFPKSNVRFSRLSG